MTVGPAQAASYVRRAGTNTVTESVAPTRSSGDDRIENKAMRDLSISDSYLDPLGARGWIQLTVHTWFADAPLVDGDQWQS